MIDQQIKDKIMELHDSGMSMTAIAKSLRMGKDTVKKYLGDKAPRKPHITMQQKEQIYQLREKGLGIGTIAIKMNISKTCVSSILAQLRRLQQEDGVGKMPIHQFLSVNGMDIEPGPIVSLLTRNYKISEVKAQALYRNWRSSVMRRSYCG